MIERYIHANECSVVKLEVTSVVLVVVPFETWWLWSLFHFPKPTKHRPLYRPFVLHEPSGGNFRLRRWLW